MPFSRKATSIHWNLSAALGAALFLASASLHAQTADSPAVRPELKPSPTATMRAFEPPENEEYTLGPGDDIFIEVPGRSELSSKHTVGPDGKVSIPIAGVVSLAGLTRDQAGAAVTQALSQFYTSISATVTVDKYAGNRVLVLGNVERPGLVTFDGTPTLLEALSRAGMSPAKDHPMGIPERIAIYRGSDQVIWVDLRALLDSGSSFADLRLRRNDRIYVPSDADHTVSVMGAVNHPGSVHLLATSTLPQVLADAGGLRESAGSSPRIQIIDPSTGKTREVNFKEILTPTGALEVSLKPGEIIFVPDSKFYKLTYAMERLNPAISVATMGMLYH